MAELNSSPQKTSGRLKRKRMSTRVDLTAMVDLAFLLITFFILTTTLAKPHVLQLTMPVGKETGPDPASRTMTICMGKDNRVLYYIGLPDKPMVGPQLTGYGKNGIRRVILENANRIKAATGRDMLVIIKPADHSDYGNLVDVLDEMSVTKTERFAIADIAPRDIDMLRQKGAY